jgi:hypothetical protein
VAREVDEQKAVGGAEGFDLERPILRGGAEAVEEEDGRGARVRETATLEVDGDAPGS